MTTLEICIQIRTNLRINMSDVAELVSVERSNLYKGISIPQNKINFLFLESKKLSKLGLHRLDVLIKRPLFDGLSTFDLLKSNISISQDQMTILCEIDAKEYETRSKSSNLKPVRSIYDAIDEISTPIYAN